MANLGLKRVSLCLSLWGLGIVPSMAQPYSTIAASDPAVLVSPAIQLPIKTLGQNLDPTLVDIKAVDMPALHSKNGKLGMATDERYGQGIIIDSNGIIATNRHIIGNAEHIYVVLSGGKTFEANLLQNSQVDLCLIKINAPFPLRSVSLGDPSELQIGSKVIAVANAGFNPQRMLGGQIIKIFKGISSDNVELLEMNIPLKPGDSGGPILNEDGSLIGLIMGKQISDPSKSYAIASSRILEEYYKYRNSILD